MKHFQSRIIVTLRGPCKKTYSKAARKLRDKQNRSLATLSPILLNPTPITPQHLIKFVIRGGSFTPTQRSLTTEMTWGVDKGFRFAA